MSGLSPLACAPSETNRVLHVDDDPDFADLTATFLERTDDSFEIETATSASEGLGRLAESDFDCVVSDYDMPGQNGIEFLKAVCEEYPDLPFILFTGKGSEEIASEAISAGVTEYLQKEGGTEQYTVLANRITNAIEYYRSRQLVDRSEKRLRKIIDSIPHLVYVVNEDGRYVLANEALVDFHNRSVEEIEGAKVDTVLSEHATERFFEKVTTVLETDSKQSFPEVEVTNQQGETRVFEAELRPYDYRGTEKRAVLGISTDVTERKARKQELKRHEAYLKESTDIVTVLDDDGTIKYESPAVARILGYEPGSLIGESGFDFIHPDDIDEVASAFYDLVAEPEGAVTVECRFRTVDDGWRWLEVRGTNQLDHPAIDGIVTNNRDITERKQREQELERASDLLEQTERIADVGGWEIDTETMEMYWTEHLFDLLGVDCTEEPSFPDALDAFDEEDRRVVETAVETAVSQGDSFDVETRFQRADGETRWLRIQGVPTVESESVVALRGAVQDITEHRERERDLEQIRAEYEELIDGMNDTAWVIKPDEGFVAVNDAAVETTGYSRAELLEMEPTDIDVGMSEAELVTRVEEMPTDGIQVFETAHETKDGERIPVEISSSLITYRGEAAILSVGRDISNRKERENQLEEFASIVSHDLRNPLSVAQSRLELVRTECSSDHLDNIEQAHDRMNTLIDDLLTLARDGDQGRTVEAVDLAAISEESWRHVETGGATLNTDLSRTIRADRGRLQQLLENLIRNSVEHGSTDSRSQTDDAVEHGGTAVTVTVGELADGFYVADDGIGIPGKQREQVLENGYSTLRDGTGLGLSIAKRIADAHDWKFTVAESADGGVRVEITNVECDG